MHDDRHVRLTTQQRMPTKSKVPTHRVTAGKIWAKHSMHIGKHRAAQCRRHSFVYSLWHIVYEQPECMERCVCPCTSRSCCARSRVQSEHAECGQNLLAAAIERRKKAVTHGPREKTVASITWHRAGHVHRQSCRQCMRSSASFGPFNPSFKCKSHLAQIFQSRPGLVWTKRLAAEAHGVALKVHKAASR
jgi:hypothetical protein